MTSAARDKVAAHNATGGDTVHDALADSPTGAPPAVSDEDVQRAMEARLAARNRVLWTDGWADSNVQVAEYAGLRAALAADRATRAAHLAATVDTLQGELQAAEAANARLQRRANELVERQRKADRWLAEAKQAAGYHENVSFDVVWAETLAKAADLSAAREGAAVLSEQVARLGEEIGRLSTPDHFCADGDDYSVSESDLDIIDLDPGQVREAWTARYLGQRWIARVVTERDEDGDEVSGGVQVFDTEAAALEAIRATAGDAEGDAPC